MTSCLFFFLILFLGSFVRNYNTELQCNKNLKIVKYIVKLFPKGVIHIYFLYSSI